jgi:hypothetical protein
MTRRRLSALFSCLLVLTFSSTGIRVCDAMDQERAPVTSEGHEHHSPAPSGSHSQSDHRAPFDHCTGATSCAGVLLAADVLIDAIDSVNHDGVVQMIAIAPASQSPDLEPPPPKA